MKKMTAMLAILLALMLTLPCALATSRKPDTTISRATISMTGHTSAVPNGSIALK